MDRRVAVTGMGVVSSHGVGLEGFWDSLLAGRVSVEPIPEAWTRRGTYRTRYLCPLPEFEFPAHFSRIERKYLDPVSVMGVVAAGEALERAGFALPAGRPGEGAGIRGLEPDRVGVYVGTGTGGIRTTLSGHQAHLSQPARKLLRQLLEEARGRGGSDGLEAGLLRALESLDGPERVNPFTVAMQMPNAAGSNIAARFRFSGPNVTVSQACASSTVSIGQAWWALRSGAVDLALAGGVENLRDDQGYVFKSFDGIDAMIQDQSDPATANRPFDRRHSGFLFSQGGAGFLVLEELGHALARGADILAELVGYHETNDAHNLILTNPDGVQLERLLSELLARHGVPREAVDYVNAHGTGTVANDTVESAVLSRLFGRRPWIGATKSLLGHTLGASGALEAIVTVQTLREGRSHACKNLEDPVADLRFILQAGPLEARYGISQSIGFGGHNAALLFRKWEDDARR